MGRPEGPAASTPCPDALVHLDDIVAALGAGRPAIFLDYDGTLTPIVERPEDARLDPAARDIVTTLARRYPLAIVSGRDLDDVQARVGVAEAFYAGSHGFDIAGPAGARHRHPEAEARAEALDDAQAFLAPHLADVAGAEIERKAFSLAVHYRRVAEADRRRVEAAVDKARAAHPTLRLLAGKMVFDFQPDIPWHKGRAVEWLMQAVGDDTLVPLYVGDDVTDEDAFQALTGRGVTVAVLDAPRPTAAAYRLRRPDDVLALLRALAGRLGA